VITLLTDFGSADYFVGAVKGAILSINPRGQIVDVSHEVPPHDIQFAAFTLGACYADFPEGTVHLAVVDPGVGSARRPIVVETARHYFVGPDNGIFTFVYRRDLRARVFHADHQRLWRSQPSATFHGRDIFAPLAARLDLGMRIETAGHPIQDFVKLPLDEPSLASDGVIEGVVIHVDHFGNCITNLTKQHLPSESPCLLTIGGTEIRRTSEHYAQSRNAGEPILYLGSAGYWEIGVWCDSAARTLGISRGMRFNLIKSTK